MDLDPLLLSEVPYQVEEELRVQSCEEKYIRMTEVRCQGVKGHSVEVRFH